MKSEAQIEVMQPQAKEYLEPPEAGRDKEVPPLEPSEGAQICPYLELGLLVFWAVREQMSVV